MQFLGKVHLQGQEKELILKEEEPFFKYYSLELFAIFMPQREEQNVVFKKSIEISYETKIEIMNLINKVEKEPYKIIGKAEIQGDTREILLRKEEKDTRIYYLNLVGVYYPKIPGDTIIFRQDTIENVVEADIKGNEQKNKISPTEKEQLKLFLENIKILDIMERLQSRERGVKDKTRYNTKSNKITQKQKTQEDFKLQQNKQEKQQNKVKDINIKQEIDMKTRVTDMKNLQQVLQKNVKMPELEHGDDVLKMGIVESDDLKKLKNEKGEKEQGHSSRYEAVMITKKGKVKTLDLENDTKEGTNPLEKNYQVKQDGTVEKGDVLTRLKVGQGSIAVEKGKYGEVEVYHSPNKTIGGNGVEGNKNLDRQLETSNSKNVLEGPDTESLKLAQEYNDGYRSVEEGYQEIQEHEKQHPNCEKKDARDIDGDKNTSSHSHDEEEEDYERSR